MAKKGNLSPDAALAVGTSHSGFIVERVEAVREIGGQAYVMRHEATGARLMWLSNDDANKSFSIAFKTPPTSSSTRCFAAQTITLSKSPSSTCSKRACRPS